MKADVVVDLSYGDCGKGKVTHHLLKGGEYTHCIRYNGGHNAGHTIYHEGKKVITHIIPAGVFFGVKSIIGPGCVVNIDKFFEELKMLEEAGVEDVHSLVKISRNAHIITQSHLEEDGKDRDIGTTKQGNGPAYRDKYDRKGVRAHEFFPLRNYLVDIYQELWYGDIEPVVLLEGAQGFGLDVNFGDYPYVTSSHCTVGGAILNGVPHNAIRDVYGVCKAYETYVGSKLFQPKEEIFNKLREVGNEYGATTGRPRQCNYLDTELLTKAIKLNGVTKLIMNKMDVLRELEEWTLRDSKKDTSFSFSTEEKFKDFFKTNFPNLEISFSYSPEEI